MRNPLNLLPVTIKNLSSCLFIASLLFSCGKNADQVVSEAIKASGGDAFNKKVVSFEFRDREYRSLKNGAEFELIRITKDSSRLIEDKIDNQGFTRFINGEAEELPDSTANKFRNSVNSVHYFAYLPYGLNDRAVNKKLLGEVTVLGQTYHKVKVWFDEQGGGEDFEDVFVYWINKETAKVDYLAYEYHTNGGGMRFREAYNRRNVGGIDFVDYRNYKPSDKNTELLNLDRLFEQNALELLSTIELKHVAVNQCTSC